MSAKQQKEDFVDRMEQNVKKEAARRFHRRAPQPSRLGGLPPEGPFCPFMVAKIGIPVQQGIIEGRQATSIQMQQAPMPCLEKRCLFWDRWSAQCGFTTLLETHLGGDEEEVAIEEEESDAADEGGQPAEEQEVG